MAQQQLVAGGDCTPSAALRCILITGNICMVGKCIFGVQPTSSLNADYENSFSKALNAWLDLEKKKDDGPCIFLNWQIHFSSLGILQKGGKASRQIAMQAGLNTITASQKGTVMTLVLTGAVLCSEETHCLLHSERRAAEGIKPTSGRATLKPESMWSHRQSSWEPRRGRDYEAKGQVSCLDFPKLVKSCRSLDQL